MSNEITVDDLQKRLQEIYAAVEEVAANPLLKPQWVTAPIIIGGQEVGVSGNWDIQKSGAKLTVFAYSAIDAIAVFYATMMGYGNTHGISEDEVNRVTDFEPLRLIRNLHNTRKHPEMRGGNSEKAVELRDLEVGLNMGPRAMSFDMTPGRAKGLTDTGGAVLTIEGSIVNVNSNKVVGSFSEVVAQSLARWEEFLGGHKYFRSRPGVPS